MSAPHSPGGASKVSASRSVATVTSAPPPPPPPPPPPGGVRGVAERAKIPNRAVGRGILEERADFAAREPECLGIGDHDLDAANRRARANYRDRLRMAARIDQIRQLAFASRDRLGQVHRFGRGGAFVEQ